MRATTLLVIGAGPYGLSVASKARDEGIETMVLGHPMQFWREHMPSGMFLRSGPDWHLDAANVHTLAAYLGQRRVTPEEADPIPVGLFIDYAEWFCANKGLKVCEEMVAGLAKSRDRFEGILESGERIAARWVVAAPGIAHFTNFPLWAPACRPSARPTPAT